MLNVFFTLEFVGGVLESFYTRFAPLVGLAYCTHSALDKGLRMHRIYEYRWSSVTGTDETI